MLDYISVRSEKGRVLERLHIERQITEGPRGEHLKKRRGLCDAISIWQLDQTIVVMYYFYLLLQEESRHIQLTNQPVHFHKIPK